jgi:hypothetical protein
VTKELKVVEPDEEKHEEEHEAESNTEANSETSEAEPEKSKNRAEPKSETKSEAETKAVKEKPREWPPPLLLTKPEAAYELNVSLRQTDYLVDQKKLKKIKIGTAARITRASVLELAGQKP